MDSRGETEFASRERPLSRKILLAEAQQIAVQCHS
jgi:hypothetical protein